MVRARALRACFLSAGLLLTQLALTQLAMPASNAAEEVYCASGNISVLNAPPHEAEVVCLAAKAAADFMGAHGFEIGNPTTVSIVEALSHIHAASSVGTYSAKTDHIEVLTYDAAVKLASGRSAFGVSMSPELYRSFIVHEIAHAIAHPNFVRRPVTSAHEYIAYTVQLMTMPESLRESILRNVQTEGYGRLAEVGDTLLVMDPARFAVKSYLHFIREENGTNAYRQLLTGQF